MKNKNLIFLMVFMTVGFISMSAHSDIGIASKDYVDRVVAALSGNNLTAGVGIQIEDNVVSLEDVEWEESDDDEIYLEPGSIIDIPRIYFDAKGRVKRVVSNNYILPGENPGISSNRRNLNVLRSFVANLVNELNEHIADFDMPLPEDED